MSIRVTDTYSFPSDDIDITPIKAIPVNLEMIGVKKYYKMLMCSESYGVHAAESFISVLQSF